MKVRGAIKRLTLGVATLALLGIATESLAQSAGTVARMGFGARGIGLGNGLIADVSGHSSAYYNPALAPFTSRQNLEASVALMSFDRQMQFLQFSTPMRPSAGIAGGLIHATVTDIDGRDFNGYHTQEYSTSEYMLFLAFGTHVGERLSAGLGLQVFRADFSESLDAVNSIGVDLGLAFRASDRLHFGIVVDDLLARYSWDTSGLYGAGGRTTSDPFPSRLRVGASYVLPRQDIRLLIEYESRFAGRDHRTRSVEIVGGEPVEAVSTEELVIHSGFVRGGLEWIPREAFAVRMGVDRVGQDGLAGARPSAGFMIEQSIGTLVARGEYSVVLEPYDAGPMQLVSLRIFL